MSDATESSPPSPSEALTRIRALADRLVASERRVAAVLTENPDRVPELSVAEVAKAANTSTATVVRACKSLGFTGFQQLRLAIARELPKRSYPPSAAPLAAVFATAIDSLRLGLEMIDQPQVDRAVATLATARRRLFVGTGASAPPVQDAALRFICCGFPAEAPSDNVTQQLAARLLGPGDVCLAVSHSGASQPTQVAVAAARDAGATTIGISSYPQSPLLKQVDISLVAGAAVAPVGLDVVTGRVSHMLLLHALQVSVAMSDPERSSAAQTKLTEVLATVSADGQRGARTRWTL